MPVRYFPDSHPAYPSETHSVARLLGRTRRPRPQAAETDLSRAVARRFEAAIFDWDGTAVADRRADASELRLLLERLTRLGFDVAIVSGTNVDNVDSQLAARPAGPGRLYLCLNRGSEVFAVEADGPVLLERRVARAAEDLALTRAAELTASWLGEHGLHVEIVGERLNRRKVDLIPDREWADPAKARIGDLLEAVEARLRGCGLESLAEVAEYARDAAAEAGLPEPRVTSDVKHVEIGLTDKSDSARWLFRELARCGLGAASVLVAGDEFGPIGGLPGSDSLLLVEEGSGAAVVSVGIEPNGVPDGVVALGGGPGAFLRLLAEQLRRREQGALPFVTPDPEWTFTIDGLHPTLERAHEALLTLADGGIGTSGAPLLAHSAASPRVLVGGVYDGDGAESHLQEGPRWAHLPGTLNRPETLTRTLDLRAGLLFEQSSSGGSAPMRSVRFSSVVRPGTVALRADTADPHTLESEPLAPPEERAELRRGVHRGRAWMHVPASHGGISAAAKDSVRLRKPTNRLERFAAYVRESEDAPNAGHALAALLVAEDMGFERLLHEHRLAWGARWDAADTKIEGDPEFQRSLRFAMFHLMASVASEGETVFGARGLTGPGYRGHVFWDTEVFVLPFLAATWPQGARTLLEYRLRRLRAARTEARRSGRAGARFPWESARTGRDVTPSRARLEGKLAPIWTGELEEHVVADVAWGAACYLDWTGDEEFAAGPGLTLFLETARYWASRTRLDADGRGHIEGVIGPDEYHERVDDNAFTNVMARWNLRRAAEAATAAGGRAGLEDGEPDRWLVLADALVDGYDPVTEIYEQFAGFSELEPLVIEEIAPRRPVAAELLLGLERVRGAQVVKQADVLMLHHLVPDEVAPGSLRPNLRFYEPRTAHGSSLSPGIHAALFARAGMLDEALELLRLTSRLDLDDVTGTTANGLHLAAMGSLWQALTFGFMGMRPDRDVLRVAPRLPGAWHGLEQRVRFRGAQMTIRAEHDTLILHADPATQVLVEGMESPVFAIPAGLRLERSGPSWREARR